MVLTVVVGTITVMTVHTHGTAITVGNNAAVKRTIIMDYKTTLPLYYLLTLAKQIDEVAKINNAHRIFFGGGGVF